MYSENMYNSRYVTQRDVDCDNVNETELPLMPHERTLSNNHMWKMKERSLSASKVVYVIYVRVLLFQSILRILISTYISVITIINT